MVEAGQLDGPEVEAIVRQALAPLLGERETAAGERETAAGERDTDAGGDAADASPDSADAEAIFPLPPGERVDTILLGCTHYPLLRPVIARVAGERVALVDSATATAAALAELLAINGLETDPGTPPRHRVITTGDVARFEAVARLLFGDDLPRAVGVELAGRTAPAPALAAAG